MRKIKWREKRKKKWRRTSWTEIPKLLVFPLPLERRVITSNVSSLNLPSLSGVLKLVSISWASHYAGNNLFLSWKNSGYNPIGLIHLLTRNISCTNIKYPLLTSWASRGLSCAFLLSYTQLRSNNSIDDSAFIRFYLSPRNPDYIEHTHKSMFYLFLAAFTESMTVILYFMVNDPRRIYIWSISLK